MKGFAALAAVCVVVLGLAVGCSADVGVQVIEGRGYSTTTSSQSPCGGFTQESAQPGINATLSAATIHYRILSATGLLTLFFASNPSQVGSTLTPVQDMGEPLAVTIVDGINYTHVYPLTFALPSTAASVGSIGTIQAVYTTNTSSYYQCVDVYVASGASAILSSASLLVLSLVSTIFVFIF